MKKTALFLTLILFFINVYTLPVNVTYNSIDIGSVEINQETTTNLYIKNTFSETQVINISTYLSVISLSDSIFTIPSQDSILVSILFSGKSNVKYNTIISLKNQFNHTPLYIPFTAECFLPHNRYSSTFNLYDNDLKSEIFNLINNHTALSYDAARAYMYGTLDNVDGYLECVYTGVWVHESQIPEGTIMNCEHTWPQSLGATGTARSDIHHLYPCDSNANNIRGNLPFGIVSGTPNWQQGGSKRGTNSNGVLVFEPRDERKGDIARSIIYFAIRYNNPSSPFFDNQEEVLKQWNNEFSVTDREYIRNTGIASVQVKRNPFVDHPEFANRIYSISSNQQSPVYYSFIYPSTINVNNNQNINIPVFNNSNTSLNIVNISAINDNIEIQYYPDNIEKKSLSVISINVLDLNSNNISELYVETSAGTYTITLTNSLVSVNDSLSMSFPNINIYPMPVKNHFSIKFNETNALEDNFNIKIYNIKGQFVHQYEQINIKSNTKLIFPESLANGIYFLKIENHNYNVLKKILYMK